MALRTAATAASILGSTVLVLWTLGAANAAHAQDSLEAAVKATYLYKFAPFVTWPAQADSAPFKICVVGADPFGPILDRAVAGARAAGRPIVVHRLAAAGPAVPCDIAYIGGSASQVREALRAFRGAPVLTVTDGPSAPGIVDFVLDHGRVRFRIDEDAASANRLAISSKLLALATSVKLNDQWEERP
jgi:hypothetical protein